MKKGIFSILLLITFLLTSCASRSPLYKTPAEKKAELYYSHGTAKLVNKNYREALKFLLKAYELNKNDTKVLNNLGMSYFFLDQQKQAYKYLSAAIDIDPKNSDALNNLGSIYFQNKEYSKALKQYNKVLENLTYQHQYRTHYNIALIQLRLGQKKLAKENLILSNTQNQDHCPASYQLGELYFKEFRYHSALKWFKEGSKGKCYENPQPLYMQALIYLELEEYKPARAKFQEVIERFSATRYSTLANLKLNEIKNQGILETKATSKLPVKEKKAKNKFKSPSF